MSDHAKKIERARKLVRDPGFQYAVAMHTFLNRVYHGFSKEQRYAMYREAGIHKSLAAAEKRSR
jgi:hypothetical protein